METTAKESPTQNLRYRDLLAIRTADGGAIGFHARSLEVAELAPEAVHALEAIVANDMDRLKKSNSVDSTTDDEAATELREWEQSTSTRASEATTDKVIRSLTINIAQVCNLACTYCAAGGDGTYGSKTKTPELDQVREQLAMLLHAVPAGDRFTVNFLGGEPLLYPDIIRSIARDAGLLVAGRTIDLRFSIVTNGTLVTPAIAELLASLKTHVTVSIDGAPDDNDVARLTKSGKGSSAMIMKGLNELFKVHARLGSIAAGSTFGKHNLNVAAAWTFLSAMPFDSLVFDFAADANDDEASRAFAKGMIEAADLAFAKGGEKELRRLHVYDHLFQMLDDQIRITNHCLAGKNHLQMDTDGRFTACQWFVGQDDEELGRGAAIDEKKLAAFDRPLIEKNGCGSCWARHLCGGGCMHVNKLKTGNKHNVDRTYCERTQAVLAKGIERYARARYANTSDGSRGGLTCEVH